MRSPRFLLLTATLVLGAGVAAAQVPVEPDTVVRAPAVPDSSATDRLLALEGQDLVKLDVMTRLGPTGLLPVGNRFVFTRDSIEWMAGRTVTELLADAAPVMIWRGGWRMRPELPSVQGRGPAAIEYFVDGLPWLPVGPDSTAVDPSLWSLELIDRMELERGPGGWRLHLFTRDHDRLAPRTRIAVATGDRGFAQYFAAFEKRYGSGLGLSLAADYTGVNTPSGGTGDANLTNGWARLSWQRSPRFGIRAQYLVQDVRRSRLVDPNAPEGSGGGGEDEEGGVPDDGTLDPGLFGTRSDLDFRISWRKRSDLTGLRVDALAARTQWSSDSVSHDIGTWGGVIGYRMPTWSAEFTGFHHTEWTSLDTRLALGWAPLRMVSTSLEGVHRKHDGERRESNYLTARVGAEIDPGLRVPVPFIGFRIPFALRLGATASTGERVQAPAITDMPTREFTDLEAMAALESSRLGIEARWSRTDSWQPLPLRAFRTIPGFAPLEETEWVAVSAHVKPTTWFTLATNYEHPLGGALPSGVPPHRAWSTATVSSRFLRNFPSGIFRLKVQGVLESWSPGVIGVDGDGVPIDQPGLTFIRGIIQLKIGPFSAYWDRVNFAAVRKGQIPGYQVMPLGSSYGIRWSFNN